MLFSKLKAAFIHGLITLIIALITAAVVYLIWYPGEFASMLGGTDLYILIVGVELCLGPLMSLVIYNPRKPAKELIRDYACIGLVQIIALTCGLYTVALSRPVFLVFVKDRIEVIAATELLADDIAAAKDDRFRRLPWFGPKLICSESPTDPKEKSDLLLSALSGRDIQLLPTYYRDCGDGEIYGKAKSVEQLFSFTNIEKHHLPNYLQGSPSFKWLPLVTRFDSWIAVFPDKNEKSVDFIKLDPFSE